jgi:hypothetical protein
MTYRAVTPLGVSHGSDAFDFLFRPLPVLPA